MTRPSHVLALLVLTACATCGGATRLDVPDAGGADGSATGTSEGGGDGSNGATGDGKIACGDVVCDLAKNEYCCLSSSAPPAGRCMNKNGHSICQGARIDCDDSADCTTPGNRICCLRASNGVSQSGAGCLPSCIMNSETYQLCRVSTECEFDGGGGCVDQTCGGRPLRTCGKIMSTSCH